MLMFRAISWQNLLVRYRCILILQQMLVEKCTMLINTQLKDCQGECLFIHSEQKAEY